jgi:hypothetical protein
MTGYKILYTIRRLSLCDMWQILASNRMIIFWTKPRIKIVNQVVPHFVPSPPPTMSYHNGTFLPSSDGYLTHVQAQFSEHSRSIIILLINIPVIAIIFNILGQLVNTFLYIGFLKIYVCLTPSRSCRKERQTLLLSSIGFHLLAQRFNMVTTLWIFFLNVRKRFDFWVIYVKRPVFLFPCPVWQCLHVRSTWSSRDGGTWN